MLYQRECARSDAVEHGNHVILLFLHQKKLPVWKTSDLQIVETKLLPRTVRNCIQHNNQLWHSHSGVKVGFCELHLAVFHFESSAFLLVVSYAAAAGHW